MTKLSDHFMRKEFACRCGCGLDTVDVELIPILEDIRSHFNKVVTITLHGGNRCFLQNNSSGGSRNSWHMKCRAADIKVEDTSADDVANYLDSKYPTKYGIGRYNTFTHIDTRGTYARWDERT